MGIKWTARLRVDFEMEDGAPQNLAETRLRTAVGEFQRNVETGLIGAGWRRDRLLSARTPLPAALFRRKTRPFALC